MPPLGVSIKAAFRRVLQKRRFQAFTVGTAKSGTTSFARLFEKNYRAAHEPSMDAALNIIIDVYSGEGDERKMDEFVRTQDASLWLEINSSQLNFFLLPSLLRVFPDSKYILTIRNCYDWLRSFINHQLGRPVREELSESTARRWEKYRDLRFQAEQKAHCPPEEKVLEERGLYRLDGYLEYWAWHNARAISLIPSSQLLIVRTQDIDDSVDKIADFLEVPPSSLDTSSSHANRARNRLNVLDEISDEYIESVVQRHCQPLMDRFFPDASLKKGQP